MGKGAGMLILTFRVDAQEGAVLAVKEALAMLLEQWGDVRLVEVRETGPEQMRIGGCS